VVAIVGIEHLAELSERLGGDVESPSGDDGIDRP
jgi:hypothetical protein